MFRSKRVPSYVLVENVKGFETSEMRNELISVLSSLHFEFQVTTCMYIFQLATCMFIFDCVCK